MDMTISIVPITLIIGYVTAIIAVAGTIVNPQLNRIEDSKEAFNRDYQSEVKKLRAKAEYKFLRSIKSLKELRRLFGIDISVNTQDSELEQDHLSTLEDELDEITDNFYNITRPANLFKEILLDYDNKHSKLKSISKIGILYSLLFPLGVVAYWIQFPASSVDAVIVLFVFTAIIAVFSWYDRYRDYCHISEKLTSERNELSGEVREKLHGIERDTVEDLSDL